MSKGRWTRAVGAVSLLLMACGCGGSDEQPAGNDETKLDGGQPDGAPFVPGLPGENRPLDGGDFVGTDGGPPVITNAFAIRGRLASAPGDKRQKGPGDAAVEHSVTHVMAVNPSAANPIRYLSEIAADGTFAIGIDLNTPWVIVLVDSHYVGSDMIAGVFRARDFDLDSLAATRPGTLELGDVSVDGATGTASATVSTQSLLTALGLSEAAARRLGSMDDISLRYTNPDIDGNGKIDVQEGVSYILDFHLRYSMLHNGQQITLEDLLNTYADPATTTATYGLGSAIAIWAPQRFGPTSAADYRVRFATASGEFQAPPLHGSYTANTWIEDDAFFYTSAGANSVGISFDSTEPFPVGRYEFEVKGTDLTFTDVRTHSLVELNSSDDLIIPFLKLNAPDATCSDWSCPVSGFDYRWMKHTETGWVLATAEELALVVPQRGGFLGFQPSGDPNKRLEFVIPGDPVSGTIPFAAPGNRQGNVTDMEIAALTVGQICHLGVSYDDTLGMRIFQGWSQGPSCN